MADAPLIEAVRLYGAGRYAEALPFAEQAAGAADSFESMVDGAVILGKVWHELADYDNATLVWEQLIAALRAAGEPPVRVAGVLGNLALARKYGGQPQDAVGIYAEAEALLRTAQPPAPGPLSVVLNNRSEALAMLGRYEEAERASDEALALRRELGGEQHPDYARMLTARALLRRLQGRYDDAEALLEQALAVYRETLGDAHPEVANALNTLGSVLGVTGRTRAARDAFEQSLQLWRRVFGSDEHPRVALAMSNIADMDLELGRLDRAVPLYDAALRILRSTTGDAAPLVAAALDKLAGARYAAADYAGAAELFERAVPIWEGAFGPRHPDLAKCLGGLAACRSMTGDLEGAIVVSRRALDMLEQTLGADHPEAPTAQVNLAQLLIRDGNDVAAGVLLERARATIERAIGPTAPLLAEVFNTLGGVEQTAGRHDAAVAHFEGALSIRSAAFGDEHPGVADVLQNLAISHAAAGRPDEALRAALRAAGIDDRLRGRVLATLSDRERIAYLHGAREELYTLLSLVWESFADSPDAVCHALDALLRRKGIAADALAAQRDALFAHGEPRLRAGLEHLRSLQAELAARTLAGDPRVGALAEERDRLERELAREIPELAQAARLAQVDHQAVARALPDRAALVEIVVSSRFDFHAVPPDWRGHRYLAFVVLAGGEVKLVDLGAADGIDTLLLAYLTPLSRRGAAARHVGAGAGFVTTPDGRALRERVFDPLVPALGGARRLFVSPDGGLARLPLESLPAADGWVMDEYEISYVSTGRDLLRHAVAPAAGAGRAVVIADPDYDLGLGGPARDDPRFEPLPGTAREGQQVAARLGVEPLTGRNVLERTIKDVRSPVVLHIATHGFFLADEPVRALPLGATGPQNALLRSGLALAGANARLRGLELPPEAEDGILYAEDVTALDLAGTELVVLSACDSGLGDVRAGEGVFGLRRAFALAGAETLVMSLWPVPDAVTQELMEAFYVALSGGAGRAEALQVAQRAIRGGHPEVADWGAFVCEGRTGPLSQTLRGTSVVS